LFRKLVLDLLQKMLEPDSEIQEHKDKVKKNVEVVCKYLIRKHHEKKLRIGYPDFKKWEYKPSKWKIAESGACLFFVL